MELLFLKCCSTSYCVKWKTNKQTNKQIKIRHHYSFSKFTILLNAQHSIGKILGSSWNSVLDIVIRPQYCPYRCFSLIGILQLEMCHWTYPFFTDYTSTTPASRNHPKVQVPCVYTSTKNVSLDSPFLHVLYFNRFYLPKSPTYTYITRTVIAQFATLGDTSIRWQHCQFSGRGLWMS